MAQGAKTYGVSLQLKLTACGAASCMHAVPNTTAHPTACCTRLQFEPHIPPSHAGACTPAGSCQAHGQECGQSSRRMGGECDAGVQWQGSD